MTTVNDIYRFLEEIAPASMKESWDNVGLLCGSRSTPVTKVLLALDPFEHVCREAAEAGAQLLVTHHPLIFKPLAAITDETPITRGILTLCRHGISAINAHTNLDQAPGGVNDVLARTLGLDHIEVMDPQGVDNAGEPWGLLRRGIVEPQSLETFLETVKKRLDCRGLRFVSGGKPVHRVAVGGGSCAGGIGEVLRAGCDTFVTADVKYNQFWDAKEQGLNLIDAGHFQTENPVIRVLAERLKGRFPEIDIIISKKHEDCMNFY